MIKICVGIMCIEMDLDSCLIIYVDLYYGFNMVFDDLWWFMMVYDHLWCLRIMVKWQPWI